MTDASATHPWLEEAAKNIPILAKGTTETSYTATVKCTNEYRRLWALRLLGEWANGIGDESGITVKSISLKPPSSAEVYGYGNYNRNEQKPPWVIGHYTGVDLSLVIGLSFPGRVDDSGYDEVVGQSVVGGVKKRLAIRTVEEYPLPFGDTLTALGAYAVDGLVIINDSYDIKVPISSRSFSGGLTAILPLMIEALEEYPIQLGIVREESPGHAIIEAVWTAEVSDPDRRDVLRVVRRCFQKFNRPTPPKDAAFMIW